MERARRNGIVVAALAAAAAGFEIVRLAVAGGTLPGYFRGTVLTMSLVACAAAIVAAVGLLLRRWWGFAIAVIGALALTSFGLSALAGGTKVGIVHLVLGLAMLFGLGKSLPAFSVPTRPASSTG